MDEDTTRYEHIGLTSFSGEPSPSYDIAGEQHDMRRRDGKTRKRNIVAVWRVLRKRVLTNKQIAAFILVLCGAILPFGLLGASLGSKWFLDVFRQKTVECGDAFGTPQNSTVEGWEALFSLDVTYGKYPFSQVKIIDIAWDLLVGRGAQLAAWWVSYIVFSNALLRVIERHPASYQTFANITLDGPSLTSMWALLKDLFRTRSKRTWTLFLFMLLSTGYVLSLPIFLSAITGYVSTTVAWVEIDGPNNLIPAADLTEEYVIYKAGNDSFPGGFCGVDDQIRDALDDAYLRRIFCDCQLANGTVMPIIEWIRHPDSGAYDYLNNPDDTNLKSCVFDYPNNTKTYGPDDNPRNCSAPYEIIIKGRKYPQKPQFRDLDDLNFTMAYCHRDGHAYSSDIASKTRCYPDTASQSYQWGFSTMLSGVFLILHLTWSLAMYIVWLDAEFYGELVKSGYSMNQLRASFILAIAANWRTEMSVSELAEAEPKQYKEKLYGSKKTKMAEVSYEMLRANMKENEANEKGLVSTLGAGYVWMKNLVARLPQFFGNGFMKLRRQ